MSVSPTILDDWDITAEELTLVMKENPSLKGMVFGYVAELKLKERITAFDDVTYFTKFDDHDRKKKGDLYIVYKGRAFDIESKSLQTAMIGRDDERGIWTGKAQVDASDRRTVTFEDGSEMQTTLLLKGEFDVLAVNCYAFEDEWRFVFCRNDDLPTSTYRRYTSTQQQALLKSLVEVTWPPSPPFTDNLLGLLEQMVADGEGSDPIAVQQDAPVITEQGERQGVGTLPPLTDLLDED